MAPGQGAVTTSADHSTKPRKPRPDFPLFPHAAGVWAKLKADRLVRDLRADDLEALRAKLAKTRGVVVLGNDVQRIRSVFKYALDAGLIDRPVVFGPEFRRPSKKALREARAAKGARMFEADELRRVIDAAGVQLKAMVLLGVNCGFGNADVGTLPLTALGLEKGWVSYPQPKTGIDRRCPLWPETVEACKAALARRPTPKAKEDEQRVFVTKYGKRWFTGTTVNPLSHEMRKALDSLGINGNRNFYALRLTFGTIGGESRDQAAVDHIMGHARDDMASVYCERTSDDRLRAVTDHVRAWLWPEQPQEKKTKGRGAGRKRQANGMPTELAVQASNTLESDKG